MVSEMLLEVTRVDNSSKRLGKYVRHGLGMKKDPVRWIEGYRSVPPHTTLYT